MTVCLKCNKPFKVGVEVLLPLTSAYADSGNGVRKAMYCVTCFRGAK